MPAVTALRSLVERHLRAFNERDFDAWTEVFHEDIEINVDAGSLHGIAAAREYAAGTLRAFPGVRAEFQRVVAETEDVIVVDYRLVNPAAGESEDAWVLDGVVCEIWEVRDGRAVALRSYYTPGEADRTPVVQVPSRAEAARIAQEQAALRRVATLVARGASHDELFAAVNEEIAGLVGADPVSMVRFEPDDSITLVAAWSASHSDFPIGSQRPVDDAVRSVRETGRPLRFGPAELPPEGPFAEEARRVGIRSAVGVPIVVEGRVWGASFATSTGTEPFPDDTEARIAGFTELVATAIANAESRAELTASRARVVAAADETRRRLQRDVHDGAQQRLVHAVLTLKLIKEALDGGGVADPALVDEALRSAQQANAELRELARGIMPAALTRGGLRAGVESLAGHVSLPVGVDVAVGRLPPALETTAYFVVAEALTNTVKHARAESARVRAVVDHGVLRLDVSDDGVGGADRRRGTGLLGLADRVAAGGGSITITSPPGEGTTVSVALPVSGGGLPSSEA